MVRRYEENQVSMEVKNKSEAVKNFRRKCSSRPMQNEHSTKTRTEKHPVDLLVWKSLVTWSRVVFVVSWHGGTDSGCGGWSTEPDQGASIKEELMNYRRLKRAGRWERKLSEDRLSRTEAKEEESQQLGRYRIGSTDGLCFCIFENTLRRRIQFKIPNPSLGALHTLTLNLHKFNRIDNILSFPQMRDLKYSGSL